ncbi:MAG: hypothetical protein M2R45_02398 [Verrucomicrobia subdivision 3 bacterium]|nr:hypothetical protein [Limisphaerales bacterium]MCS1416396.1 hypothetical protein [Limisphaerales bacterium]
MEPVERQTAEKQLDAAGGNETTRPDICLRQLWKTGLLVQNRVDSRYGVVEHEEGRTIGSQLISLCRQLLGNDLKFAQSLLVRGASLKSKKENQQLFPSGILNKCFFKSRGEVLRFNQGYGETAASYAASGANEGGSGTKQFGEDFSDHLKSLNEKLGGEPTKDDGKAVEELALYVLSHVTSVFKDDVRRLARESKPFEIAARAVFRAFEEGDDLGQVGQEHTVLQAYCGSVLHRLESVERLGAAKSAKIFNKYLASLDEAKSGISLEKILGDHSPKSFPELHHLPAGEFVTLAGGDSAAGQDDQKFLGLLAQVSGEITLRSRELSRFDAYTNLHFSQEFQIKEDETDMEPVRHCSASRQLMSSYRQVRSYLSELGLLGGRGQHYFGWYSIPRVLEAFLIGQCTELSVTGILLPGMDVDPWSESLSDLRMEYRLAKVERNFYEPPLAAAAASAYVYLVWEIAALGVSPESIEIESSDEAAGTLTLSFNYAPADSDESPSRRVISYTMADIEVAQCKDLNLPNETDPVLFVAAAGDLPSALLFVGDNVVKELPLYHRISYGKNVALYVLETKIAPKVRKERPKPSEKPAKKVVAKEVESAAEEPAKPKLTGMSKMAADLLEADRDLKVLHQETLAWTKEVLVRIASEQKVTGKQRRNFRRLHHQLRHRECRGFSNRLEGEFMTGLANLSKQFDAEGDALRVGVDR